MPLFDLVVLIWLAVGLFRGWRNGVSLEVLLLPQWVAAIVVGAVVYPYLGGLIIRMTNCSAVEGARWGYVAPALVAYAMASRLRHFVGNRLADADMFGKAEFRLGAIFGLLRFACMALVVIALIDAYLPAEWETQNKGAKLEGVGGYSVNPVQIQREALLHSWTCRLSRAYLKPALIWPSHVLEFTLGNEENPPQRTNLSTNTGHGKLIDEVVTAASDTTAAPAKSK